MRALTRSPAACPAAVRARRAGRRRGGSGVPLTSTWRTPIGLLGGEPLAVGGEVAHAPGRAGCRPSADRTRTRRPSSPRAGSRDRTKPNMSAGSPVSLRTACSSGMTCAVAHPRAEQVGRQRRVAQLVDVGARVGEPERHVVVGEQVAHRVDVVVGDVGPKARREVLGDAPARTSRRAGRSRARVARSLTRRPCSSGNRCRLGDLERLPARLHRRLLQVGRRPGPPLRIAVRGDARRRGRPAAARRTPCRC